MANAASFGCALVVFLGLLMWVGSFFGPDGFAYAVFTVLGLLSVLSIWVEIDKSRPAKTHVPKPITEKRRRELQRRVDVQESRSRALAKDERERLTKALRNMEQRPPP